LGVAVAVLLAGAAVGTTVQGASWFGHAVLAVVVVVVTGVLLLRTRSWLVAPGQLVAVLLLVTGLFTDGGLLGLVPGPSAFGELGALLSRAGDQINTGIPPVPANPEILLLVTLAFGVLAIAVFGLAVTVGAPAAAGVPLLCVFAVPTALDDQLLPWWSMAAAAAGFGVLLVARGDRLRQAPGGVAIAALAVVGALLLGTAATAVGTAGRFDAGTEGAGSDGAIGLNPFTSLRGQLTRSEPRDLFRVSGLEQPAYMRALTLQSYVPQSGWQAGRPLPGVPLAGPLPPGTSGPARDATAQVANLGFEDYWLPVFGDPVSITGPSETDWSYDAAGGIAYSNRPREVDGWTQRMRLPDPSADALRAATGGSGVDPAYLDTDGLDPRVVAISRQVTAQATTPFDRAMALNEYFSGPGSSFRYSLATAPGGGGDALVDFLTRGRTGYCEQFASAMAVMLRAVDVPARVAVGFTAGTPGPDGRTVTTNDAHAWVEAWFPGYGWQTFDPTPLADGRTVEPQYVQQARAHAGRPPPTPPTAPPLPP
ncbi:MAG: transglutaminase-like domain-containing protein, partial [Pseudonocardia sp.]|nr:transglutaminase-like domain-containing protein [Pseudonocardia sp.]